MRHLIELSLTYEKKEKKKQFKKRSISRSHIGAIETKKIFQLYSVDLFEFFL